MHTPVLTWQPPLPPRPPPCAGLDAFLAWLWPLTCATEAAARITAQQLLERLTLARQQQKASSSAMQVDTQQVRAPRGA
jgi:hypothetical protein